MEIGRRKNFGDLCLAMGYRRAAEVGVWRAEFAAQLLSRSSLDVLYLVDPYDGRGMTEKASMEKLRRGARRRMRGYGERARFIEMPSLDAVKSFKLGELDFVYIDANHEYAHVMDDCHAWWLIVREGGVLAGHDYKTMPGNTKQAVQAFAKSVGCEVRETTREHCSSWWIIKKR